MKKTAILGLFLFGSFISCNQKSEEEIAKIVDVLQSDLQNTSYEVTNSIPLLETLDESITNAGRTNEFASNAMLSNETIVVQEFAPDSVVVIDPQEMPAPQTPQVVTQVVYQTQQTRPANPPSSLYVIQNEVYIKVGDDIAKTEVSRSSSQKITVAVFPQRNVVSADIYIYAIPTSSPIVRNYNTLIGYAQGIEFINGQAQFTRYWKARRSDGRFFRPGLYNVYVEYHYKNKAGNVVHTKGRFWGGNHRSWTVRVR